MNIRIAMAVSAALIVTSTPAQAKPKKTGTQATELDPTGRGAISGIGIESRDIDAMADMVFRDIMGRQDIMNRDTAPRIILDNSEFRNESSQRINSKLMTDTLRASLNRTAAGKVRFINRQNMARIQEERELKRTGVADTGTTGLTKGVSGADFFLAATMTSLDSRDGKSGIQQRRTQIVFELIDVETGDIVYTSEPYVTLRAAGEDVIYR